MEQVRNEIKRAVIRKERLNVNYNETLSESNYTNSVAKNCDQVVHSDLKDTFRKLKLHLVFLCEQPESNLINKDSFNSPGFHETLPNYVMNGYSHDSIDGISGVTLFGQKLLNSGKVIDLKIFAPLHDDTYPYYDELDLYIKACDWEVEEYLFNGKWGIKQETLDFETDEPEEANLKPEPKTKGRSKKVKELSQLDAIA